IDSLGQELPEVNACGADGHCLAKTRLGWQTIAMKQESPASAGGGRFKDIKYLWIYIILSIVLSAPVNKLLQKAAYKRLVSKNRNRK
ncbi:MAG: hypothetical protein IJI62_05280, partial [Lachnospiraceae bacterium]|nr:hypothetical protein [Lachnospiraceae bacterium]